MRRLMLFVAFSVSTVAIAAEAEAESRQCRLLAAELAASGGRGNPGQFRRYDAAYRKQAAILRRQRRLVARYNCQGGLFGRRGGYCGSIISKARDMERNLAKLARLRDQYAGARGRSSSRIRAAMRRAGCGSAAPQRVRFGLFDRESTFEDNPWPTRRSSTYRTLCVRRSDGFFFPVSFSTTRDRFGEDLALCQQSCPGADVDLYTYRNPGEGPEDMVSLRGEPYSSHPAAFKYRTDYDGSANCSSRGRPEVLKTQLNGRLYVETADAGQVRRAPLPRPRPAFGTDPETVAGIAGGMSDPETIEARAGSITTTHGRRVRVVGPAYWGDQSAAAKVLIQGLRDGL